MIVHQDPDDPTVSGLMWAMQWDGKSGEKLRQHGVAVGAVTAQWFELLTGARPKRVLVGEWVTRSFLASEWRHRPSAYAPPPVATTTNCNGCGDAVVQADDGTFISLTEQLLCRVYFGNGGIPHHRRPL